MATLCLIIGESGSGKSTAIRTLDPKETFLIQALKKPLPWKGSMKAYVPISKENPAGNYFLTDDSDTIIKTLDHIHAKMPHIKTVVIDDFQYTMTNHFMRHHSTTGKGNNVFSLYNEIGDRAWNIIYLGGQLAREDLIVFFLSHNEKTEDGQSKIKTIGKMLDEKVCLEGMFTIVLNTALVDGKYVFQTQTNGRNTSKSPIGMFAEKEIPNDLSLVAKAIREYNS